jgi:hypothetical protein
MLIIRYLAITDTNVGLSRQNRRDNRFDITGVILIIRISVDNYICAFSKSLVQTRFKCRSEPAICTVPHDVMHSKTPRHTARIIDTPVINNQILNVIKAFNFTGKCNQCFGQRLCFVGTRYLNDKFHCRHHHFLFFSFYKK